MMGSADDNDELDQRTTHLFTVTDASTYLKAFFSSSTNPASIPQSSKMVGPDGYPYVVCDLPLDVATPSFASQSLLEEGYGLVIYRDRSQDPLWVYKYRDLLCYRIFGTLQPPPHFDEIHYGSTLDKPLPPGTQVISGRPGPQIFPSFVRDILEKKIGHILGHRVVLNPLIVEYPSVDSLKRFKLNLSSEKLADGTRRSISALVSWYLPYVVYF